MFFKKAQLTIVTILLYKKWFFLSRLRHASVHVRNSVSVVLTRVHCVLNTPFHLLLSFIRMDFIFVGPFHLSVQPTSFFLMKRTVPFITCSSLPVSSANGDQGFEDDLSSSFLRSGTVQVTKISTFNLPLIDHPPSIQCDFLLCKAMEFSYKKVCFTPLRIILSFVLNNPVNKNGVLWLMFQSSSPICRLAAPPPPFKFVCSVPGGQECTPWCSMANFSVFL